MTTSNFVEPELFSDDFDLPDSAATPDSETGLFLLSTPADRLLVAYGLALRSEQTELAPQQAVRTALLLSEQLLHADDRHARIATHRAGAVSRWSAVCNDIQMLGETVSLPKRSGDPRQSWQDFHDATVRVLPGLTPLEVPFVVALWIRKVEIERHLANA